MTKCFAHDTQVDQIEGNKNFLLSDTIFDAKGGGKESSNGVITSIVLSTSRGQICLMFEDEKLLNIWRYVISCILASLKKAREFNGFIYDGCSTSV